MSEKKRQCQFWGFQSEAEGCPVQDWFNGLSRDAQDEVINLILHLQSLPSGLWQRPEFDLLEGEGGISELRPEDIRSIEGGITYRIYGIRGYPDKYSYTFLHAAPKDVKNDKVGKGIAKWRLQELGRTAKAHRFNFETESDSEIE